LHDLIRSEIRKTTSKRNYVNVCSSGLSQKLTITMHSSPRQLAGEKKSAS
jgi:hypothetical protein